MIDVWICRNIDCERGRLSYEQTEPQADSERRREVVFFWAKSRISAKSNWTLHSLHTSLSKLQSKRLSFPVSRNLCAFVLMATDGWAGADSPPHTQSESQHLKRAFSHFSTRLLRTNQRIDVGAKPLSESRVYD